MPLYGPKTRVTKEPAVWLSTCLLRSLDQFHDAQVNRRADVVIQKISHHFSFAELNHNLQLFVICNPRECCYTVGYDSIPS